jgi:hypothetical protein
MPNSSLASTKDSKTSACGPEIDGRKSGPSVERSAQCRIASRLPVIELQSGDALEFVRVACDENQVTDH